MRRVWFGGLVQANMLPEAVRVLAGHLMSGRRTYVHCTAGINRATLTVVGYLCMYKVRDAFPLRVFSVRR